ncbi:ATP-grasp fold amidoligase family protein [Pseudarthrobacter sp. PS3-L1]|uniref:ATP-grasp fold amidoligase family protein n=1 Tax=Pseudarthrobacter sp. PS3-L1 TaxID=3046207 RepID=UPI0024BB1DD4|nr:ATP-grasp fold amidoligase family protein [Pseudarthrobacter sp. PS3-L1]MDJ0321722.1 ATP-grasp fold amidoligase family protein [Pseudarthrobacter sp. PS3-L1]
MPTPWTNRIADRNSGKESGTPWWVNDKYLLHKFCKEHGFPMPEVYKFWKTPHELNLDDTPKKFVLKPTVMFSAWGVMLLERLDDGTFHDELQNRILTFAQVKAEQLAAYERCKYKGSYRLMMEEKVEGRNGDQPIPLDYKVSVFYDQPGQVHQINRNPKVLEYAFFDGQFAPLDLGDTIISDWATKSLGRHDRPADSAEMLKIACELTMTLKTPFMRVDMFAGPQGPVIGELTPSPGDAFYGNNFKYTEKYDLDLGQAWLDAERRIEDSLG